MIGRIMSIHQSYFDLLNFSSRMTVSKFCKKRLVKKFNIPLKRLI